MTTSYINEFRNHVTEDDRVIPDALTIQVTETQANRALVDGYSVI